MALTEQERQIVEYGQQNGKSKEEVLQALAKFRSGQPSAAAVPEAVPERSILDRIRGGLDLVFGGGKVGEAIGTEIAKARATPEERALIEPGPSAKQIAGDVAVSATNFFPVGRVASGATKILSKVPGAKRIGQMIAGAGVGASADISRQVAEDDDVHLALGTLLGAGSPLIGPALRASSRLTAPVVRTLARGAGRVGAELSGALTGTSAETIEQAFVAASRGGTEAESFSRALRGQTTPEQLVENVRTSLSTISANRQRLFSETMKEIATEPVETAGLKETFAEQLADFGIVVGEDGLDFSASKLRTVPAAQKKLQTAYDEIAGLPENATLAQIDTARQALKVLRMAGEDPSANAANRLIDDAVRDVREVGESVPGYGQMLDQFGETTEFLDEIERGLMAGDKATIDQTYRRMTTALRTNNEQRMALIRELDAVTGGSLLSDIAGQQLSETLPRGIFRQIAAGIAGGAAITGGISSSLIPALVFASPRVTGEFVRGLGIGTRKARLIVEAVGNARDTLGKTYGVPGDQLIKLFGVGGAIQGSSDLEQ